MSIALAVLGELLNEAETTQPEDPITGTQLAGRIDALREARDRITEAERLAARPGLDGSTAAPTLGGRRGARGGTRAQPRPRGLSGPSGTPPRPT